MLLTKYEHACLVLTENDQLLVVDPGSFAESLPALDGVVGVVVTHEHQDHWTPDRLRAILDRNPDARLFAPAGVAAAAPDFEFTVVDGGDTAEVGPFRLAFHGSQHAVIHSSIPVVDNVGVLVNDTLFHPGDSYTVPPVSVDVLGVPASAPWLKIGEVIDYIAEVKPSRSFPLHERVNSDAGNWMANDRIGATTTANGGEFFVLQPGESKEL